MHDLRVAVRALRATPIVSAIAIVSLTLGIGANSAIFSIVNAVLLKPLPYAHPDRLVLLGYTFSGASASLVSETKLNVWKEQAAACGLGLAFGHAGIRTLLALNPADLPRIGPPAESLTADWRVLSFTLIVSVATGLVCGVWPAIRLSGGDQLIGLASGGRSGATVRERRVRSLLVVAEMALALVLLVGRPC
jgi:hypothetical protein